MPGTQNLDLKTLHKQYFIRMLPADYIPVKRTQLHKNPEEKSQMWATLLTSAKLQYWDYARNIVWMWMLSDSSKWW